MRPVLMTYDPNLPMAHYRMAGCHYVTCRCVIKAFIGKTPDGRMAYFDMDDDKIKTDTRKKILSGNGTDIDSWTGEAPHNISFWLRDEHIQINEYAELTTDPVFSRYFNGTVAEQNTVVRLPLDFNLFATQDPDDILPLHASMDTLSQIKRRLLGGVHRNALLTPCPWQYDPCRIDERAFRRWRKWLSAGGSLAGDGALPLAIYGCYYDPRHEDPNYVAF
jgi:hypothetical protein